MATRKATPMPDIEHTENASPKTKRELRQEAVDGILQLAQFGCLAFGQFADAGAIGMHGQGLSNEVITLSDNNPKIASKVDLLIEIGPYAGLVAAALPFLAQILVNHKVFKPEQFANAGVVTPETLEAQMKTQLMQRAMESKREQMRIQEEMQAMEDEMRERFSQNGDRDNVQADVE